MKSNEIKNILGPSPLESFLHGLGGAGILIIVALGVAYVGMNSTGIVSFLCLCISLVSAAAGIFSFFAYVSTRLAMIVTNQKYYKKLFRRLQADKIKVDYYAPARGQGDYLIIDKAADKIFVRKKEYKISDITNISYDSYAEGLGKHRKEKKLILKFSFVSIWPEPFLIYPTPEARRVISGLQKTLNFS